MSRTKPHDNAFPTNDNSGLSIREYFSITILQGMAANIQDKSDIEIYTMKAVIAADALIEQLNKEDEKKGLRLVA